MDLWVYAMTPKPVRSAPPPSLRLSEPDEGTPRDVNILAALSEDECATLCAAATLRSFAPGAVVFRQGDAHDGIFIILSGQVRSYYSGPSGREITLAYWSPSNFVGGPEMFGGSPHVWSGQAVRHTQTLHLRGAELRRLMERMPRLAVALVEALVAKGKAYSALIHMLGTRSAAERLAQLLLLMAGLDGRRTDQGIAIGRTLTQEELAKMVGSTRQWVTTSLDRFREQGLIAIAPNKITITDEEALRRFAG